MKRSIKVVSLLIILMMVIFLLAGCSGTKTEEVKKEEKPSDTAKTKPAEIKLKLGHCVPAGQHQYHQAAERFAKLVNERTNGEIKIEIFPSELLGKGSLQVEACSMGTLDFTIGSTAFMASYVPESELTSMPLTLSNWSNFWKFMDDSKYFKEWSEKFLEKSDVRILGLIPNGEYMIICNQPITKLEDLKGKKWRGKEGTKKTKAHDKFFGTVSTGVVFGELYSAFKTGVIDGMEVSISNYKNSSLYEVAPYVYWEPMYYAANPIYMSNKTFNKLSDENKEIILESAKEACSWIRKVYEEKIEPEAWEFVKKQGAEIYYPTPEQKERWQKEAKEKYIPAFTGLYPGIGEEVYKYMVEEIEGK